MTEVKLFFSAVASRRFVPVILVHHNGDVRVSFHRCQDEMAQEVFPSVVPGTTGSLQDNRTVGFVRRLHDGLDLLHVIDVERGNAIAILSRVVEQETHRYERHKRFS
jgi:hypothetical protein